MQSYPQSALPQRQTRQSAMRPPRPHDDVIYQVVTIAAMVIVLVSVWIF
jgi:hypothetical protein